MTAHLFSSPWPALAERLRQSSPYRTVLERGGDVLRLPLAAAAWVGQLAAEDLGRPLLVVVPREADALGWLEACELFGGAGSAVFFPAPSLSPYQEAEISLLVRAQEAVALAEVLAGHTRTIVSTPRALFRRLPTAAAFAAARLVLEPGGEISADGLLAHLLRHGYHRQDLVTEVGEVAVRGGVFDLFPPGAEGPIRLDLFGDTLESIRRFDPVSQRSEERLERALILPLGLFPEGREEAAKLARLLAASAGPEGGPEIAAKQQALASGVGFAGWQNLLPLLAPETWSLLDAAAGAALVVVDPRSLEEEVSHHRETLEQEYLARREHGRLAMPPDALEHDAQLVAAALEGAWLRVRGAGAGTAGGADFEGTTTDVFQGQLPRFPREIETGRRRGDTMIVVVGSGHRRQLEDLLEGAGAQLGEVGVVEGELQRGFRLPAAGVSLYSEHQFFGRLAPVVRKSKVRYGPFIASLRDLKVGDFVVHSDHGIGRFVGLRSVGRDAGPAVPLPPGIRPAAASGAEIEVMEIAYSNGQTLLLPLSRLDQVQKYSGIEGLAPRLDTLGGSSWNRTKSRVKNSLRDMAEALLKLYAERQLAQAPEMGPDSDYVNQFAAAFEFEETPDQLEAIETIKEDLGKATPMDRLLCGDVGYGKTEVAMRAAFKAVDAGFQVAVLAPTTILADQHLLTFRKRFAGFPVTIDMVSRFRNPAEIKEISQRLAKGKIDVLVGTHRLLSRNLAFANLGLLIVDEEQRFGVAQKEQLKKLKRNVHVLAMSATPVPRTLQLSLAGVRDLSVIETPPKDRMAVETAILPFSTELIREAIEFELERGGQVYFVYNRVETIERMQTLLRETVPAARVTVGHGQMDEEELARRMHSFTAGEHDVLLATTIIENGIDIPNVNTMIVHRADRFGLAQLYQLRGRVGRSHQLAYCYLLVPPDRVLSETARKRLAAIREFSDLGAGFRIAARDLEIRGAGNLLGAEQSGHISAVGIETYLKMLEEAVKELRGETVDEAPAATLDLPVAMSIPQDYVKDANLRMEIYRKIAAAQEPERELFDELSDRFGRPPEPVRALLKVAAVKRLAESLRVQSVSAHRGQLVLRLRQDARVDVERLIGLVSSHPGASFSPTGVLTMPAAPGTAVVDQARDVLAELVAAGDPMP